MDAFISRKRRRLSPPIADVEASPPEESESTDLKLAILASTFPDRDYEVLLDYLLAYNGSVPDASAALSGTWRKDEPIRSPHPTVGYQSSLSSFAKRQKINGIETGPASKLVTKKGQTLHLYDPADVEAHTPCSMVHNFLPTAEADALLRELLDEVPQFSNAKFQIFDRTVESPHTYRFYVNSHDEVDAQKTEYFYNGGTVNNVARSTPEMLKVAARVQEKVNQEIARRTKEFYPEGQKLKFQSREEWKPNASFVNCYDGGKESVGYHSDQLTYLGPRAVIGSLSLGVAREFRVRRIVPPVAGKQAATSTADLQGQIAIHLPHNSLLIMHAEMQEEWKHAIAPAQAIDPHPLAGNKRLNVTYRCYKDYLHPKYTPKCKCGVPTVLKCVQRRAATRGRYMWQCDRSFTPGEKGCDYFVWAEFDEDGRPPWVDHYKGNANGPAVPQQSDAI